ncbi:MAG TPA: tetratricopeptide repeat protein [Thermoanaerobaculia bacterium]|nr:tetratricopeptide repeat protein [Thermoanaerobaculia bacterium]
MADDDREITPIEIGRFARVEHLLLIGQIARARELAVEQISRDPNDARSYLSLARVLQQAGEAAAAVDAAAHAVGIEPESPSVWSVHASTLYSAGRFAECEASLLEAIRLDPDDGSLFQMYARVLSLCRKPKDALRWADRALELDPEDESAHHLFAALLHEVHPSKWRVSEDAARRAIALNPEDADSFAILGAILATRRQFPEAEEHFRTALALEPHNRIALEGLAMIVMAQRWWYRPFLTYQLLMMRLDTGAQLLVVGSMWALFSLINAVYPSTPIAVAYLLFCAYTWFASPITRAILRRRYSWL